MYQNEINDEAVFSKAIAGKCKNVD